MLDEPLTSDNLPDLSKMTMTNLEPGTAYRFRLAAINSCGVGEFGEVILVDVNVIGFFFTFPILTSHHRLKLACLVSRVHRQQLKYLSHRKAHICRGNHHQVHRAKS